MLIRERLEKCDFSNSERAIVDFIFVFAQMAFLL